MKKPFSRGTLAEICQQNIDTPPGEMESYAWGVKVSRLCILAETGFDRALKTAAFARLQKCFPDGEDFYVHLESPDEKMVDIYLTWDSSDYWYKVDSVSAFSRTFLSPNGTLETIFIRPDSGYLN
jgi:hypothetical protein